MSKLTDNFLDELLSICFTKETIVDIISRHLRMEYIPFELQPHRKIFKSIIDWYKGNSSLISYGVVSQQYEQDPDVQELIAKVKESKIPTNTEAVIDELQEYIKDVRFQLVNEKIVDLYKEGKKEEARRYNETETVEINNLSLRGESKKFLKVFKDFEQQQIVNANSDHNMNHEKLLFGVDPIDNLCGGIDITEIALWIFRSGGGKSTALKWTGFFNAFLGYDVLHFQLEGSEKECHDKYTQVWTGLSYPEIRDADIPEEKFTKLKKIANDMMKSHKDIDIYGFEKFGEANMAEIREIIIDYYKTHGKYPDLIIIDSIDLVHPGDGLRYGVDSQSIKMKLKNSARAMKNIAIEFNTRIITATQTGSIPKMKWDDEDFVIDRDYTEGDRTLVQPFSYVFSGNQTSKEKRKNMMRVFIDKFRNYDTSDDVYPIITNYDKGRFYNPKKTIETFYQPEEAK